MSFFRPQNINTFSMCFYVDIYVFQEDKKEDLDPNDPFAAKDAAEHDKMVALAQSFEQKYVKALIVFY